MCITGYSIDQSPKPPILKVRMYFIKITSSTPSFFCYQLTIFNGIVLRMSEPFITDKGKTTGPVALTAIVYPNPHQGNFTLQIESPEDGMATIELFNSIGQIVIERKSAVTKGKGNSIQFNNVREAILHYRVRIGRQIVNGKIIGQH